MCFKIKYLSLILLSSLLFINLSCKDPLKEEDKKEEIIVLVNETLREVGRYIFLWDGKDKNGKVIEPGKYIYTFESKDFNDQDYMEAVENNKIAKPEFTHFEAGVWYSYELEAAEPNPFNIETGVAIAIKIPSPTSVKIRIFKD